MMSAGGGASLRVLVIIVKGEGGVKRLKHDDFVIPIPSEQYTPRP